MLAGQNQGLTWTVPRGRPTPTSLLTQLNLLRQRKVFTDVLLKAGGRSFPCHRAVLASCSRYFEAMFSGGLRESRDAEVDFHDSLHPEVLELLLDYAYSARVIINEENAESLLEAGDMLQFHDIRDAAAEFLEKNLHQSNCLGMMLLSDAHQCRRLYEPAWRMCLADFAALVKTEDFLRLPGDKVQELILSEELEVEDESLVYEAVIDWAYLLKTVASEELVMCHKLGREIVEDAVRCKTRILQNDGIVTGFCARPRKVSQALLLLGGQTFMCDKVYVIDNKTKEITPKTDIPSPRKECSACAIGCKVYVTGVEGSENGASKDVWVYDTLHEEWSKAAPMLVARFGHGSAELDHMLFVTNKWTLVAPLREGVINAAVVGAKNKALRLRGHQREQRQAAQGAVLPPLPEPVVRAGRLPAAVALHGGGGGGHPRGGDWRRHRVLRQLGVPLQQRDLPVVQVRRRDGQADQLHAVASGNRLYVVGGYCGAQRCKTLDCYDPASDSWDSVTSVPYSLIPTAFVSTWKYLPA
ncbi:unnamed protein product, partial [Tetraodon nigroviridis]